MAGVDLDSDADWNAALTKNVSRYRKYVTMWMFLSFVLLGTCFSLQAKLVQQHHKRGVQQHDKDHRLGPYCSGNDPMCLTCPNSDVLMIFDTSVTKR